MRAAWPGRFEGLRGLGLGLLTLLVGACATAPPEPATGPPPGARAAVPVPPLAPPKQEPLPEVFESERFVVTFARPGDTTASLAARYLGDAAKAWMVEDYLGATSVSPGQEVVLPKRPWNPSGVEPSGYQLVPVLVYHNLAPEAKGRMVLAVRTFEAQMRYLKAEGYRVVSLEDLVEFTRLGHQLPKRSVVLTFDDGYKSFRQYAYPILKELGFTATLFVYADYVGAGRNALGWQDLRELEAEGFHAEAHSKTHSDLRRLAGESDAQFARRMQAELAQPLALFQRQLGKTSHVLAYPYGATDEDVVRKVQDYGYVAAFTVRREGNPSFVEPLRGHRSQIYSEMSLQDFIKNLNVFQEEDLR